MTPTRLLSLLLSLLAVSLVNSRSAELTTRINKASIDVCLEGWLRGEASIIGAHADQENFYFEWVPTGERYPFKEFPAFYNQFKGDALARTGWYNVTFYNFIQWEEGTQLYESAQWVVDGYDSGDYTLMVDNGLLKWGRTQKLPYLTKETFQGKHLCNKPDRVCKTAVVKAKKAQVNSRSAELTTRINKASIDVCLEGWLRGEASIIGAHADQENFYFEWVPTGERYPFKEFPAFYNQFKGDALARTGWYNVTFYNFIQWEEGTQLYESAQWVVDGYDSGDYTLMVDNGLLKWGRTQKLPYLTMETFQGKHLCNKPDRVCKTAVVKAKAERAQVFPQY